MERIEVTFKKLVPEATIPIRAYDTDAGFDIKITSIKHERSKGLFTAGTGLAINIPKGFVGLLFPRSSICKTRLILSNAVGVIDSGYIGEIMSVFNLMDNKSNVVYNIGDRALQLIIMPLIANIEFKEVTEFSVEGERGSNGFGSTGV